MIKHLIILFLISKCLAQLSTDIRHQNLKFNSIDIWKNENKRIKNSELKKELIKLSEKFRNKR